MPYMERLEKKRCRREEIEVEEEPGKEETGQSAVTRGSIESLTVV